MTAQQKAVPLRNLQATVKEAGFGTVKHFFDSQKKVLLEVLPEHVKPERLLRIATGALRTTPMLMNASIESLFGAIVQCAQLGLEPNTPLGHAYLIPFNNRRTGKTEVQVVFGYKGLIDLSRRSGQIVSIAAHPVYENDEFIYQFGLDEKLEHKPSLDNRGEVIAFYAVAKLVGGGHAFEVMSRQQVEHIRNCSQNYMFAKDKAKTVWGQNFEEMGRKTVLRRLFKFLPVSIELATASALDSKAYEETQGLDDVLVGEFTVTPDDAPIEQLEDDLQDQQEPEQPEPQPQQQANKPAADQSQFDME